MLAFQLKSTEKADVGELRKHFDAEAWRGGASFVEQLGEWRERARACSFANNQPAEVRDILLEYHKQLVHAAHHFRATSLYRETKLLFTWHDSMNAASKKGFADWAYERAAVLFNLAASLSMLATDEDRTEPAGLRAACHYFQQAAGVVDEALCLCSASPWVERTADMTSDFLAALRALLLAQAQKCFFEKASAEKMSDSILAKISAECAAPHEHASARALT